MRSLLLAALLVAPLLLAVPAASACRDALGVPCGRIYPVILLATDDKAPQVALSADHPLDIATTVTFRFDMVNEGYTVTQPNDPIVMTFEFPRKPTWVDMSVKPDTLTVDVTNPTNVQPDPSDPTKPQASYVWTTKVTIHIALNGAQPVLRDGLDYVKLLVFAKTTESGLYQSGYGIKEFRVAPANAVHESDVAGQRDVFTATPVANFTQAPARLAFGGETVTLTPPKATQFWAPNAFDIKVEPAPTGQVAVAVHDEGGNLTTLAGPMDASSGDVKLNVTLAKPGLHTFAVTLLPAAGSSAPPMTFPLDFVAGDLKAEGYAFPKTYSVATEGTIPAPNGNSADPLAQFERDIPFFAYDTAQSVSATVNLATPGAPTNTGLSNLQVALIDPEGKKLQSSSLDPVSFPTRTLRVGAVPGDGWYTLRVSGVGAPTLAGYNAQIEVAYASTPTTRNHADGVPDITPETLSRAGRNVTLATSGLAVWTPGDITPKVGADAARYTVTIFGANGTLAYASGPRSGKASFTAPAPGAYRAFVYAEPTAPGGVFSPTSRAFAFEIGGGNATVAQKFTIADAPEAPTSKDATTLAIYAVPYLDARATGKASASAAGPGESASAALVDANGKSAEKPSAPGTYFLVVSATNPGPAAPVAVAYDLDFPSAQTLLPPTHASASPKSALPMPGVVPLVGIAVLAALLARRR